MSAWRVNENIISDINVLIYEFPTLVPLQGLIIRY